MMIRFVINTYIFQYFNYLLYVKLYIYKYNEKKKTNKQTNKKIRLWRCALPVRVDLAGRRTTPRRGTNTQKEPFSTVSKSPSVCRDAPSSPWNSIRHGPSLNFLLFKFCYTYIYTNNPNLYQWPLYFFVLVVFLFVIFYIFFYYNK